MQVFDQIRTSQGQIPVRDAELVYDPTSGAPTWIDFHPVSAQALAGSLADALSDAGAPSPGRTSRTDAPSDAAMPSIENLSVITRSLADALAFAKQSGPLFGVSLREQVDDWQAAIALAQVVVGMQEVVNGTKPLVATEIPIEKVVARVQSTQTPFAIYTISFDLGRAGASDYAAGMPPLPMLKKFRRGGVFDYAFMSSEVDEDRVILTTFLLSFQSEISAVDFAAAVSYFMNDPHIAEDAVRELLDAADQNSETALEDVLGLVSLENNLLVEEAELNEDDIPQIKRLVYALISLHLQGVRVDVFGSTEGDDFMSFDTYLGFLWYRFARKLGQVKIGYCERCGKGFSLTGQRGIRRRFCSQKCKTEAKNERMKLLRDAARERFMQGDSVAEIARDLYPKVETKQALEQVRSGLRGWKQLQHEADGAIVFRDERRVLLQRCIDEGVFEAAYVADRVRYLQQTPRAVKEIRAREKE